MARDVVLVRAFDVDLVRAVDGRCRTRSRVDPVRAVDLVRAVDPVRAFDVDLVRAGAFVRVGAVARDFFVRDVFF